REQAAEDVARTQRAARLEKLLAPWDAFKQSQAREPLAAVQANEVKLSSDSDANHWDGAPEFSSSSLPPKPSTTPADPAKNTAMAPEKEKGAPNLSSLGVPPLAEEHSPCESTNTCSASTSPPAAPSPPLSDSGHSELDNANASGEIDSTTDDSGEDRSEGDGSEEDGSEEDDSDDEQTGVSSTSAPPVSSTSQARADSQPVPQHILDNWAS
ncbi:unnamed protein product, partial [Laminaria digitata]